MASCTWGVERWGRSGVLGVSFPSILVQALGLLKEDGSSRIVSPSLAPVPPGSQTLISVSLGD